MADDLPANTSATEPPHLSAGYGELHERVAGRIRGTVRLRLGPRALEQAAAGPIILSGTEADAIAHAALAALLETGATAYGLGQPITLVDDALRDHLREVFAEGILEQASVWEETFTGGGSGMVVSVSDAAVVAARIAALALERMHADLAIAIARQEGLEGELSAVQVERNEAREVAEGTVTVDSWLYRRVERAETYAEAARVAEMQDEAALERVRALCDAMDQQGITSGAPFTVAAVRAAVAGDSAARDE